jgi:nucleoside permease NupC
MILTNMSESRAFAWLVVGIASVIVSTAVLYSVMCFVRWAWRR